ncbi:MAG TPA: hypothetical protein VGY98_01015 [Verrucomicrobiae bacterium]|nr:hypothetical protein [Verrucomicrobiae bacterium]
MKNATLPTVVVGSAADSAWSDRVVHQEDIGDCACGPCAIFNAFQFGSPSLTNMVWGLPGASPTEKVRNLISMYGGRPSSIAHEQPRYLQNGGMWDEDVAPFINDWLREEGASARVHGERLVLQKRETPQEQLNRVYRELSHSLAAGFPPVVNLQSYAADGHFSHYSWNWLDGHFVTVVAVQQALSDAGGFSMWVADSQSGHVLKVSVCAGSTPFRAITGKRVRNGKEIDQWTDGYPYLTIRSPKLEGILEGDAATSHPQTICVLQFVVHR